MIDWKRIQGAVDAFFEPSPMLSVLALVAASSLLAPHPARAGAVGVENGTYVEHVSSVGLDLSTPEGQDLLRTRVRLAARDVCLAGGGGSVTDSLATGRCVHAAYQSAQGSLVKALAWASSTRATLTSQ